MSTAPVAVSPETMPGLDVILRENVAPLLLGSWFNCSMYAVELGCAWLYFRRYQKDSMILKIVLAFMICNDTANTALQCVIVYLITIIHFGDVTFIGQGTVYYALQVLLPSTTALICQSYLIHRFWTLSKNYIVTGFLILPVLGAYISVIYATIALVIYTSLADRVRVTAIGTAWLSLEAASDTCIAIALIIQLAYYTRRTNFQETQNLLKKLMINAAETGAFTAILALSMLTAFLLAKATNINTGFSYVLGRAYSLTLFVNLLVRPFASEDGLSSMTASNNGRTTRKTGFNGGISTFRLGPQNDTGAAANGLGAGNAFDGNVQVEREVQVHIDTSYANSVDGVNGPGKGFGSDDERMLDEEKKDLERGGEYELSAIRNGRRAF